VSAPLFSRDPWPSLPYDELRPTVDHLHRLVQIGGKYTLNQPYEFNWGNIVLSVTPRGFSTPTLDAGDVLFTVDYELLDDRVTGHGVNRGRLAAPWTRARCGLLRELRRSRRATRYPAPEDHPGTRDPRCADAR
jgi:hypothetical protein